MGIKGLFQFLSRCEQRVFVTNAVQDKLVGLDMFWFVHQSKGDISVIYNYLTPIIQHAKEVHCVWDGSPSSDTAIVRKEREVKRQQMIETIVQLDTVLTYQMEQLTEENELKVEMTAKTTEDTIINLTQHSYFNLDGHSETIANQELFVNSSKTLETNIENIPTGNFFEIARSPFDFNSPKECPTKIDNTFVLNKKDEISATLFSTKNNLKMSVFTNQPAVHIYVGGNCFNQIKGKENASYNPISGICFEAQNFPDAPNHEHFPSAVLKKEDTYSHKTIFKFEKL